MQILKAYKYRLDVTPAQHDRLVELVGCARWVWNEALAECLRMLDADQRLPGYNGFGGYASWITHWKGEPDTAFLASGYTDNLQQKVRDLDRAWKDCFDTSQPTKQRPQFKAKHRDGDNSIHFVNFAKYCRLDNRRVKLPAGLGWLRLRRSSGSAKSRPHIEGEIKNCTITRQVGHWYISFQVEQVVADPVHPSASAVGVDMGVSKLIALSDGRCIAAEDHYRRHQARLAKVQRSLARKQKFSRNWRKQKARINQLHSRIARCRHDYLHKATTQLSKNHAMIAIVSCSAGADEDPEGGQHDGIGQGHARGAGAQRASQSRLEQGDPGSGLVRSATAADLQTVVARRSAGRSSAALHQSALCRVRRCPGRQ